MTIRIPVSTGHLWAFLFQGNYKPSGEATLLAVPGIWGTEVCVHYHRVCGFFARLFASQHQKPNHIFQVIRTGKGIENSRPFGIWLGSPAERVVLIRMFFRRH